MSRKWSLLQASILNMNPFFPWGLITLSLQIPTSPGHNIQPFVLPQKSRNAVSASFTFSLLHCPPFPDFDTCFPGGHLPATHTHSLGPVQVLLPLISTPDTVRKQEVGASPVCSVHCLFVSQSPCLALLSSDMCLYLSFPHYILIPGRQGQHHLCCFKI